MKIDNLEEVLLDVAMNLKLSEEEARLFFFIVHFTYGKAQGKHHLRLPREKVEQADRFPKVARALARMGDLFDSAMNPTERLA